MRYFRLDTNQIIDLERVIAVDKNRILLTHGSSIFVPNMTAENVFTILAALRRYQEDKC